MGDNNIIRVPIFYGDDLEGWISWVEKFFSDYGYSDEEKVPFVYGFIEGDARTWFEQDDSLTSWEAIKSGLFVRFGNSKDHELARMRKRLNMLERFEKWLIEDEEKGSQGKGKVQEEENQISQTDDEIIIGSQSRVQVNSSKQPGEGWEVKNELLKSKLEIPVFDDKSNKRNGEQSQFALQVFDKMILGGNRVVRKRRKRKFTKAKRFKYKCGKVDFKPLQIQKMSKSRILDNMCNIAQGKLVDCHVVYTCQVFEKTCMLKFIRKKKRRLEEHEREGSKHGEYIHERVYGRLLLRKKTAKKKLAKWKKHKFKQKLNKEKKINGCSIVSNELVTWEIMLKRKKAQVGNRVESHQMLDDVPSRIKEATKRKMKPPKSTKNKCGWKKNTKELLNDTLSFSETMLLQGVTKKRKETYTPSHKMKSIKVAMKLSEFHLCTSYGYDNGNIFLMFEMLSDDIKKEDLTARTWTLKLKIASFEIRSRAVTLQRYTSSSEDILKHATKLLKGELHVSVRLIGLRMSHFNGEIHNSDSSQGTITKFIVQKDPSRQDLDDNDSFDLVESKHCLSNDEGLSLSFGSHETSNAQLKDDYTGLIQHKRAWVMKRGTVKGKLAVNSTEQRFAGLYPVMPEEVGIPLRVYGYSWNTIIFGARIWHHIDILFCKRTLLCHSKLEVEPKKPWLSLYFNNQIECTSRRGIVGGHKSDSVPHLEDKVNFGQRGIDTSSDVTK